LSAKIIVACALLAALAAGCREHVALYLERRDTIALHAGDASRYNAAVHAIDPWPAGSQDERIAYDGARAARVIERYRTRSLDGENADKAPASIQIPIGR